MHTHKHTYATDRSSVFEGVGDTIIYIWKWEKENANIVNMGINSFFVLILFITNRQMYTIKSEKYNGCFSQSNANDSNFLQFNNSRNDHVDNHIELMRMPLEKLSKLAYLQPRIQIHLFT